MRREGEHGIKDNPKNLGVFVQGDRRAVDVDGWVAVVLAGPGSEESY